MERTLVDLMAASHLWDGWVEIWRSLAVVDSFDLAAWLPTAICWQPMRNYEPRLGCSWITTATCGTSTTATWTHSGPYRGAPRTVLPVARLPAAGSCSGRLEPGGICRISGSGTGSGSTNTAS